MKYNSYLLFFLLSLSTLRLMGQTISGMVADQNHEPLIGATVLEENTQNGIVTDVNGKFSFKLNDPKSNIVISYTGYETKILKPEGSGPFHIMLSESEESLDEVVVTGSSTFMDKLEPKHVEIITAGELAKAACCNLSESFETNASVDVSYTDAITGAKTIQMLGLDGRYVQTNRENTPYVRGLIGRYGLGYVPGTWIQSIDVGKGAGTVVNGYESMTGQLNVELKKPESSEKLYLNGYVNSFGRVEINANHATDLSDKWSTGLLLHTNYLGTEIDGNDDGFMDLPKSRQINFINRYKYDGERLKSQIGLQVIRDEKAGGQLGYDFGDDFQTTPEYGFMNQTTRAEVFGKVGVLFPSKPYQGLGFIYSGSYTDIEAGFGRDAYSGKEKTIYGTLIYQNIIGNSFHQYKTGVSLLYDDFDEAYADSAFARTEVVPGAYFEYSFLPGDDFSLILGNRVDFHNLYGTFYTPRLHTRYAFNDNMAIRLAIGRGYRVGNPLVENINSLVSNRQFVVTENLDPEISWNMGGSLTSTINIGNKKIDLIGDYFYTTFENQLIYDMDQNSSQVTIYNLDGQSYAHSFQVEAKYQLNELFGFKTAYKYYDVRTTINGELRKAPFISRDRLFLNASYATKYDKWKADATLQWFGTKRLPNTSDKPTEFQVSNSTPDFFLLNAQVSRGFRWGNIYLGSENLLNFKQENPIVDAENPFGNDFDASLVWAPIAGRMIYAGIKYRIER
ncbi:carboxypeptidase-like regulatory domain-containing protein [Marinoscillum sp.]|uniref:TonB-dependent receptor plug domain-containing protein n=1 Tax=Marinoscillum sp. TaxID=2024838 RepID=UPI003BAB4988